MPAGSFSTTFNNSTGLTLAGSVITIPFNYTWNATDDVSNNKLKMVGTEHLVIQIDAKAQADNQTAKVLVQFVNGMGLSHSIFMVRADDYTVYDANFYGLFFGRDARCGSLDNIYIAIEKSWGKGGSYQNVLCDPQYIGTDMDPSVVYRLEITSVFYCGRYASIIGKLYSVVGDIGTLIATTTLTDYYGGIYDDPITTGDESEFVILGDSVNSRTYYVDNYSFEWTDPTNIISVVGG